MRAPIGRIVKKVVSGFSGMKVNVSSRSGTVG